MDSLSKPKRIGAYDVVSVIGRGGMGTVFKATDPRIGRSVAIKVLTAAADDPDLLLRFYREAKYTGNLQHQNIVTVYELGHQDGIPYLVMEYLEGVSLEAQIASGRPMPIAEKLRIILQVCSGLAYAHKRDLVHRDIKPANIVLVENGTAKIVDFGIARLGGNRLTKTGHIVGSLNYMSPEQLNGNVELDLRTDLYSTGVVLFQLLTGVLPFEGGSTAATLRKIVQDPPPTLAPHLKDCLPELEAIVQKALAKNREDRYPSAEDFAVDIARVQQRYERQMLTEYLKQAADSLQRRDFAAAREQVLQVLRVAPQNVEGGDLLRIIKQGQDQQQREQQVLQLQVKAEEAFRKNEFSTALQFIEQGLQLDFGRTVFLSLRDAIFDAQTKMARYREALQRADTALRSGDLEAARQAIDGAIDILPDEPECKRLAAQIAAKIEQRLRDQKAAQAQKQFAVAVNLVEKAMADARMLTFLGRIPEALQALEKATGEAMQLPPRWGEQLEASRKEALARQEELQQEQARQEKAKHERGTEEFVPPPSTNWRDPQKHTGEMPAPFRATEMLRPETAPAAPEARIGDPVEQQNRPRILEADLHENRTAPLMRPQPSFQEERPAIAPELLEFLEPEKAKWSSRPIIWLGVAVAILVGVVLWLFLRPRPESHATVKPAGTAVTNFTYAEINAEPWATLTDLTPANGEAQSVVGSVTPLRVKLPAGQYILTLEGPNHEQKQVEMTVPQQGGTKCFVVFRKPDVDRILSQK